MLSKLLIACLALGAFAEDEGQKVRTQLTTLSACLQRAVDMIQPEAKAAAEAEAKAAAEAEAGDAAGTNAESTEG